MEGDYLYERVLRAINENGSINVSLTLEDLKQGFEKLEADMNNLYEMYENKKYTNENQPTSWRSWLVNKSIKSNDSLSISFLYNIYK